MLKIIFVVMLLSPGMTQPFVKKVPVDTYAACLDEMARVQSKAVELNARGEGFRVLAGCEWDSEKSDPA
jgi:hypothetical protein